MADNTKTREQVEALHAEGKTPAEIAEALGKSKANIYVHLRNIAKDAGEPPRKRGRPPALNKDGETPEKTPKAPSATKAKPSSNGHDKAKSEARFPHIRAAIEEELKEARSKVATLEKMLETAL